MCCCAKPNVNGTPGYSWDGKNINTRPVDPPKLADRDLLLFDEPGRCGGMDSHCHHYRLVKTNLSTFLLVRHGGGEERMRVSLPRGFSFDGMDSNTRYCSPIPTTHSPAHPPRWPNDRHHPIISPDHRPNLSGAPGTPRDGRAVGRGPAVLVRAHGESRGGQRAGRGGRGAGECESAQRRCQRRRGRR